MRSALLRLVLPWTLAIIGGCAGRAPVPIEIDGGRLTLNASGTTERLDFVKGQRSFDASITFVVDENHENPDYFSAPVPQVTGIYGPNGRPLLSRGYDTKRLDVKISDAMEGPKSNFHEGGVGKYTFHFPLSESVSAVRVEGTVETSRVADVKVMEVSLLELAAFREIVDRCRVRARANELKDGKVTITVDVELAITDASRAAPNVPIIIEVLADDGSILGRPKTVGGASRFDLVTRQATLTTALPEGRQIKGVLFHVVRAVEWNERQFVFANVAIRGPIGK